MSQIFERGRTLGRVEAEARFMGRNVKRRYDGLAAREQRRRSSASAAAAAAGDREVSWLGLDEGGLTKELVMRCVLDK